MVRKNGKFPYISNGNKVVDHVDASNFAVTPVPVEKLRRVSVVYVRLAIFEKNNETTITKHSYYSPGASVFTNGDLH